MSTSGFRLGTSSGTTYLLMSLKTLGNEINDIQII
jgi:hypothetical protein